MLLGGGAKGGTPPGGRVLIGRICMPAPIGGLPLPLPLPSQPQVLLLPAIAARASAACASRVRGGIKGSSAAAAAPVEAMGGLLAHWRGQHAPTPSAQ